MFRTYFNLPTVLSLLLITTLCMGATLVNDWFVVESEGFKIEFPVRPDMESRVLETEIGELKMDMMMYDASENEQDENLVYGLIHTDYPDEFIVAVGEENLDDFFRSSIDGSVERVNGKLLAEEKIKIDGHPGREIMVDFQEGLAIINMRFYLVNNRMYVLQAISETGKEKNRSVARFMNSFTLTK